LGRARFGHAYDGLAVSAIRFLGEHAGENAIRAFAERRVAALIGPHVSAINARTGRASRAEALASALSKEGYAASTRQVGAAGANVGVQLCQHHCPVAHVAAEFPQLCEAETEAFAKLLGTHVQRLATIARGDAACTTHVPVVPTGDLATIPEEITTEKIATEENGQSGSKSSLSDIASTEASFSSGRTVGSANGGQSR
jgi:predicted ArsR family transcriptional regulator